MYKQAIIVQTIVQMSALLFPHSPGSLPTQIHCPDITAHKRRDGGPKGQTEPSKLFNGNSANSNNKILLHISRGVVEMAFKDISVNKQTNKPTANAKHLSGRTLL